MANKTLTKKDKEKVLALREKFPAKISIKTIRSADGGFVAFIKTFAGCNTQGNTLSELIFMVNDCVKCYLNIPEKYYPFMPNYQPPVKVAHDLDIFPASRGAKEILEN
ncbi:MAG: type II toxin-antitoxin system HicB family antitoxin [Patescibacteria group bacterium]